MRNFDLSKLPLPDAVVRVDFQANLIALLKKFKEHMPEYGDFLESDPVVKIMEACAYVLTQKDQERNDQIKAVLLAFAKDRDLDNLAANFATTRLPNESDSRLKERVLLSFAKLTTAGAAKSYEALALEATPKVLDVLAYDKIRDPAKAFVSVLLIDGLKDSEKLEAIEAVKKYLNQPDKKPLGAQVLVAEALPKRYTIAASISIQQNVDSGTVLALVNKALVALVESKRRINSTLALSEIYATINIEGVAFVRDLSDPKQNIAASEAEYLLCEKIEIKAV